jgi:tryptophanyl-tRNA synthetase
LERVFSGIQPTGEIHVGNYLGAIRNWVQLQHEHECFFCVVDLHALTSPYEPEDLARNTLELATGLVACGIDLERSTLFVQSHVPQHAELAWMLAAFTPLGHLHRQTHFKTRSVQQLDEVNAGLFSYPILQAADILLYKSTQVPVGEDQAQHLELAREVARQFNDRFGETFPPPQTMLTATGTIRGLDGQSKMSKSLDNTLRIDEEPAELVRKLDGAAVDPNRQRDSDAGNPLACNIFTLQTYFTELRMTEELRRGCESAHLKCQDCKRTLATNMEAHLAPIRQRWVQLRSNPDLVRGHLEAGRDRCLAVAGQTMADVRHRLGLL